MCPLNIPLQSRESIGVEQAEHEPDDRLSMLEANESNDWLTDSGEEDRAYKCPRHGTRKRKVVVCAAQLLIDIGGRCAVDEHIVGGLDVEGLLNLCIWSDQKVEDNESWKQQRKCLV